MATFVQIEPDAFNAVLANVMSEQGSTDPESELARQQRAERYHHVRRPVRGIQIKDDTYATIQVRNSKGHALPLFDAAAAGDLGKGIVNSNFIIQSVQEQRAEKHQVIMTFGAPYIFFFGEQPRIISVTGVLLNTEDFNWRAEWLENYDRYLRGTQCVRNKARVYLSWDDIIVEGYLSQCTTAEGAENRNLVQFQFQMYVTNYQNISSIGDPNAHWQGKDINLDPSTVDGSSSSTLAVRQANLLSEDLASGRGKNSLFEFLRSGDIGAAATRVVELQGQVVDLLSAAGQFVSGRNIRVPVGFEGAAAFDQEVQLALASIPGAQQVVNGTEGRVIRMNAGSLNIVREFRAALGSKYGPSRTGLSLSQNHDEFVAIIQHDETGVPGTSSLPVSQTVPPDDGTEKVREVFEMFGIDTDPPSELTLFFKRAMFGIVSLGVGMNVANSSTLRSSLNSIGTVL